MTKIIFNHYDRKTKKRYQRKYEPDKAKFICNVPEGRLLKKRRQCSFYIYNPRGKTKQEQIREVPYPEAKELVKQYGTREQYCDLFTVLNADGTYKTGKGTVINIDRVHKIRLERTASLLSMNLTNTIYYLIDKYDDMGLFNRTYATYKKNGRTIPYDLSDLSEFTS